MKMERDRKRHRRQKGGGEDIKKERERCSWSPVFIETGTVFPIILLAQGTRELSEQTLEIIPSRKSTVNGSESMRFPLTEK